MAHEPASSTDRRTFLQAGAVATASAVSLGAASGALGPGCTREGALHPPQAPGQDGR